MSIKLLLLCQFLTNIKSLWPISLVRGLYQLSMNILASGLKKTMGKFRTLLWREANFTVGLIANKAIDFRRKSSSMGPTSELDIEKVYNHVD